MRSRVAAQMLGTNGFNKVYNLTGGIKAWKKEVATGDEETGLHIFRDLQSPEEAVIVGFGLEIGLRDFYLSLQQKVALESTRKLLGKLADMEILHQERLVALYGEITGSEMSITEFGKTIVEPAMEGGLTTEEYLQLYDIDLQSEVELLGLALAIEAQALDLYLRSAARSKEEATRQVLLTIAAEERNHIGWISRSIDQHQELA